jgi:sialate O-acetylesterase
MNHMQALDPYSPAKRGDIIPSAFGGIVRLTNFSSLRSKNLSLTNKLNSIKLLMVFGKEYRLSKILVLFACIIVLSSPVYNQVRLPRLISNGMVLQRDCELTIWGWASANENIHIQFLDSSYHISASAKGEWAVKVNPHKAGGPYKMIIRGSNEIIISDILFGDVWVCSGQSNMELQMRRAKPIYENEIAGSLNPNIRQFVVPQKYNFNSAERDLAYGNWISANPMTVLNFSAVAYFFAKELNEKYKVPIGLINASVGGSPAESWMSEKSLKNFPVHLMEAEKFKDSALIKQIEMADNTRTRAWYTELWQNDLGIRVKGNYWYKPDLNTEDWSEITIPGYFTEPDSPSPNGVFWFRKEFKLPSGISKEKALLVLGRIVDADSVFLNGTFVGTTSYQYPPRRYEIPAGILNEGSNCLVVRIISNSGKGGFVPDKKYELIVDGRRIDLSGKWKYKQGAKMAPLAGFTAIRFKPEGLYNGMINPLLNYRIKGVIWYQGESNAERAVEYRKLFPALISDWRVNWKQGDFPFLFVQLANFMETRKLPSESNWALLREAQAKTLALPKTGMAITIDLGEWNDIHPLNKKDVGFRLALAASKIAYAEENLVYSGPVYQSMRVDGKHITLSFTNTGSGLNLKTGSTPCGFSICGPDKLFVWAEGKIVGNQVIVWNDKISQPIAVRYAWADNPVCANLYNKEGLPAVPFRTDE